jgi:hypothetical protein
MASEFTPSPALAALAAMGYTAAHAIDLATDDTSLDMAFAALREFVARQIDLSPGEQALYLRIRDQAGNPPLDLASLGGLLAHRVQWLQYQRHSLGRPA